MSHNPSMVEIVLQILLILLCCVGMMALIGTPFWLLYRGQLHSFWLALANLCLLGVLSGFFFLSIIGGGSFASFPYEGWSFTFAGICFLISIISYIAFLWLGIFGKPFLGIEGSLTKNVQFGMPFVTFAVMMLSAYLYRSDPEIPRIRKVKDKAAVIKRIKEQITKGDSGGICELVRTDDEASSEQINQCKQHLMSLSPGSQERLLELRKFTDINGNFVKFLIPNSGKEFGEYRPVFLEADQSWFVRFFYDETLLHPLEWAGEYGNKDEGAARLEKGLENFDDDNVKWDPSVRKILREEVIPHLREKVLIEILERDKEVYNYRQAILKKLDALSK